MGKKILIITALLIVALVGLFFYRQKTMSPQDSNSNKVSEQTYYGKLTGTKKSSITTSRQALVAHFENVAQLTQEGFEPDNNLSADGPGASSWGYKKTTNGMSQVIIYSYRVEPTSSNPNEPLQFNCPCKVTLTTFTSDPFSASSNSLANPASVNCKKVGGTTVIQKLGDGAEYGLCDFGDNMACEEWALMNGNCPVGGFKTTGFDNIGQKYCAWLGGKTYAVPNSQCTLPGGKVCSTDALYAGTCSSN